VETVVVKWLWSIGAAILLLALVATWASDKVTWQAERTIFTVRCDGGGWQGLACSGRVTAAERFRFRALKPHREVLFWEVGGNDPSGKMTDCTIQDGRNWSCPESAESGRSITRTMVDGFAVHETTGVTRPFVAIDKWKWLLLFAGVPFSSASY
jgi:hypothetical protein